MKQIFKIILIVLLITNCKLLSAQVGINDNNASPDASAMLDVKSTDKGMLIPRMTTAQRDAIASPATGLMVYNTTTTTFDYYNGTAWVAIGGDNLGDHITTKNLQLGSHWLSSDGDDEGIKVDAIGNVSIGNANQHNGLFQVSNFLHFNDDITTPNTKVYSSNPSNISNIIDNNDATNWATNSLPAWIIVDLGQGKAQRLTHYSIRHLPSWFAFTSDHAPTDWTFEGSNDSLNWTVLDTKSSFTFTQYVETFPISNANAFRYYRINITAGVSSIPQYPIAEITLVDTTARQMDFISISDAGAIKFWDAYTFPTQDGKGGQTLITDGSGQLSWANQMADVFQLNGNNLELSLSNDGVATQSVDLSNINTDNQTADVFQLNGNNLELSLSNDGVATQSVDLSNVVNTIIADADNNTKVQVEKNTNEDIIRFDAGGIQIASLSKNANNDFRLSPNTNNIFIGADAGNVNAAQNNVFIGTEAGRVNTTGTRNTFIGSSTGYSLVNGINNVFVGALAGKDAVSTSRNTFIGDFAGAESTGGSNTALGASAGSRTSGNFNVFIGDGVAYNNYLGSDNTILGAQAGRNMTGSGNIFIGRNAGYSETGNNLLFIDNTNTSTPLIYGDLAYDTVKIYGTLGVKDAYHFPIVDGTNGQVLQTDGSGQLSWVNQTADVFQLNGNNLELSLSNDGVPTQSVDLSGFNSDNQTADVFQLNGNNLELSLSNDGVPTQSVDLSNVVNTLIADADNNTKVQVEKNANEDIIRFDAGGIQIASLSKNTNNDFRLSLSTSNILIGADAGNVNTAQNNVFIGTEAGRVNTTGTRNTFIGNSAGYSLVNGINNVFVGAFAGKDAVSTSRNTFIGDFAGAESTGASNTALGASAGSRTSGNHNVFIGDGVAYNNYLGGDNTILGAQAGHNMTGSGNIFIGRNAGYSETGNNLLFIDNTNTSTPLIYGDLAYDTVKIYGTLGVKDAYHFPIVDGTNGQILQTDGSGKLSWTNPAVNTDNQTTDVFQLNGNNLELSLSNDGVATQSVDLSSLNAVKTLIADADNNTKVQVEKNANDDIIRFDAGGIQIASFSKNANDDFRLSPYTSNIFMGIDAGNVNTAQNNVFIGNQAGKVNTTGTRNTFIGSVAGLSLVGGIKNVFVGAFAGKDAVNSSHNTFIGDFAGAESTGASNTALGASAGSRTSGNYNVFIGENVAYNNYLGSDNTILGAQAGLNMTGSGNIFIGRNAGYSETGNNLLFIDNTNTPTPLIYGDLAYDTVKIYGTLGVKDAYHFPIIDGTNGQMLQTDGSGKLSWSSISNQTTDVFQLNGTNLELSLSNDGVATQSVDLSSINVTKTLIEDADQNTKIQVEKTANDDIIRLDAGGTEIAQFSKNANGNLMFSPSNTNVFFGKDAGSVNAGTYNLFLGDEAGKVNSIGLQNTFVGAQTGFSTTSGGYNVFLGTSAGYSNSTGDYNVLLGYRAGRNNTTGSRNVFIGNNAGYNETGNDKLYIDNSNTSTPLIYGDFAADSIIVNGASVVTGITYAKGGIHMPNAFGPDVTYVGDAGNSISFGHAGNSEDFLGYKSNTFYFRDSPGGGDNQNPDVYAKSFIPYSSGRWKHNVHDLKNALKVIQQLRGVTYTWNEDHGGEDDFGFIAEEVHDVLPEIAPKDAEGQVNGVAYGKLTPYLVEAIKEQQAQIEQLKQENEDLKKQVTKIEKLEAIVKQLQEVSNN